MALLRLELNNILCFNNFKADFSYPKKLINSPLEYEYLRLFPNLRYKKVNIIVGANASGKTSLGKAILILFLLLKDKESKLFRDSVNNKNKEAYALLDYVYSNGVFFRFEVKCLPSGDLLARYRQLQMGKNDSYESLLKKLPADIPFDNYLKVLENVTFSGWRFNFPTIETGFDCIRCKYDDVDLDEFVATYQKILKTLDPSISKVFKSKEQENTFIIKFDDGKTVSVKDGESISGLSLLSSGTKYAINIAGIICAIKHHDNGFYYVDEQFSYVNSDIEIACLATMIELLGDGEQLFFTSHNYDILDISLPNHSFNFIKKEKNSDGVYEIKIVNASVLEKRNNVSVKNMNENDYFGIAPDTSAIFDA